MEQKRTVTEITNDTNLDMAGKVKELYLDHNKSYDEIGKLLGIAPATARYRVSIGGYCKRKPGERSTKYGDLRTEIKEMCESNPNTTVADITRKFGCSPSVVRKYGHELGITFAPSPRGSLPKITSSGTGGARRRKTVVKPQIEEVVQEITSENDNETEYDKSIDCTAPNNSELKEDNVKPYEVMDYPFVIYKGHVYEIMTMGELRKELRKALNIKRRKR